PEADAGDEHQRRAEPGRPGVVTAVDPASHLQGREDRDDGEAGGDEAEPDNRKAKLERPVGGRDPDDEDQRLQQRHMGEERDEQAIIDVALWGDARARLINHRRIVSRNLVSRFRSSQVLAAHPHANFGIKGTLASFLTLVWFLDLKFLCELAAYP